jgi:hypothetical protein
MSFEPFKPGNEYGKLGGGRPKGSKNKLHRAFIEALTKDFEENGDKAIRQCRVTQPGKYLALIASTLPREFFFEHNTVGQLSDDELDRMIEMLRERVQAERIAAQTPLMLTVEKIDAR